VDTITGCWEGALISDHGGDDTAFALTQPARELAPTCGTTLTLAGGAAFPARLLDGAARALVALVEGARDPESGAVTGLLLDARVRGDRMVGHWMRRDAAGHVLASGHLTAGRATTHA
jgi:hypothetical protein